MKQFLESPRAFGRVHHRFLNNLAMTEALHSHCGKHEGFLEIAEGDVCWLEKSGRTEFLLMHPEIFNRLPAREILERRVDLGEVLTLDRLLESPLPKLRFMVEIKAGHGPLARSVERLVGLLEDKVRGRYCIDCFSPSVLRRIKELDPGIPTSLHTRLGVYGSRVVKTAFEWPPVALESLSRVDYADVITVTYKYSPARYLRRFSASIDRFHRQLFDSGKRLVFGGVESRATFERVRASSAVGAYWKFDKHLFTIPDGR